MKYRHNSICTIDDEIEVGKTYQYYESLPLCIWEVEVIADESDEKYISFQLKPVEHIAGMPLPTKPFNVSMINGQFAFSGMWRLYDSGSYMKNLK